MELQWRLFYGVDGEKINAAELTEMPETLDGVKGENICFADDVYTGKNAQDIPEQGVFTAEIQVEEDCVLPLGFGCCYFYQVFLNGESILDRRENGNKPYFPPKSDNFTVPAYCRKGKNLLTVVLKSVPGEVMHLAFRVRSDCNWHKCQPSIENFSALVNGGPYPAEGSAERRDCCQLIQNGVLQMRNTIFNPFAVDGQMLPDEVQKLTEEYPILYFYEKALDRIIKEAAAASPGENEVFFWHLYNMGYVVKTSYVCFGLDLSHRRAVDLAEHMDFVLTTHNHADHCDLELFKALAAAKKQVITNFYPAPGFHRPPVELEIDRLKISMRENDHNSTLQKFVASYLIKLPNDCVIFAVGDSREVAQLEPDCRPDIFIPHPRVGLSVPAAVKKFHPRSVLYSHFLEMRHTPPTPWYAVPYDLLDEERAQVEKLGAAALAPLWGEKLVWNTALKRFI